MIEGVGDPAQRSGRLYGGDAAAHIWRKYANGAQGGSTPEDGEPPNLLHQSDGPPASAVYVIDDDLSIRRALSRRLKLEMWDVLTFDSCEAFLADLNGLKPGCLVLDIQLGGMSGLDLLAYMKNARPNWPIFSMSGSDNDSAEAEALRLGARAFFRKPFDSELLVEAITQAFA